MWYRGVIDEVYTYVYTFTYMNTKIQKWGNSLAVRLPKALTDSLQLAEGSTVRFVQKGKKLEIEAIHDLRYKKEWTLKELLKGVSANDTHPETEWGSDVGNELSEWK